MIVLVAFLCLGVLWSSIWVGAGALLDPKDNTTLQDWTRSIGSSAQSLALIVTAAAFGIGVVGLITVLAAWRRSRLWVAYGTISMALLLATLALGSAMGYSSLKSVITKTHERIGPVNLVAPLPPNDAADSAQLAPTPLSQEEAEAGVQQLFDLTAGFATGPMISFEPISGDSRPLDPTAVELVPESCTPDPGGQLGAQFRLRFTMASDEDGRVVQQVLDAWKQAGYPQRDQVRDDHFTGSDSLPIGFASINDSFTIDGNVWVTIESRCATVSL